MAPHHQFLRKMQNKDSSTSQAKPRMLGSPLFEEKTLPLEPEDKLPHIPTPESNTQEPTPRTRIGQTIPPP
jgi:hypothetical protein